VGVDGLEHRAQVAGQPGDGEAVGPGGRRAVAPLVVEHDTAPGVEQAANDGCPHLALLGPAVGEHHGGPGAEIGHRELGTVVGGHDQRGARRQQELGGHSSPRLAAFCCTDSGAKRWRA
jgi:hypothetical protein